MKVAVAKRPIEQFQTAVTLPETQIEPDNEAYFGNDTQGQFVDENGMPTDPPGTVTETTTSTIDQQSNDPAAGPPQTQERRDRIGDLVESVTGRRPPPEPDQRDRRRDRSVPPPQDSRPNQ